LVSVLVAAAPSESLSGQPRLKRDKKSRAPHVENAVPFYPQLTEEEKKIEQALDKPITVAMQNTPLKDFIDFIRSATGLNVYIDRVALEDEGVALDTKVTVNAKNLPLRTVLGTLKSLNLTYLPQDGQLVITSETQAGDTLITRIYPVGDLCKDADDLNELVDVIHNTIQPDSWDEVGGPGTVVPWTRGTSLVILQTYHLHRRIVRLLAALRSVRLSPAHTGRKSKRSKRRPAKRPKRTTRTPSRTTPT